MNNFDIAVLVLAGICLLSWTPQGRGFYPTLNLNYVLSLVLTVFVVMWIVRHA